MKKLMIVAVAAAMTGVASAAECVNLKCEEGTAGATAYTVSLSLKTTYPKTKVSGDECCEDCTYYNVQKTMKYAGIIWGEAECEGCTMLGDDLNMLLWNTTIKEQAVADLALFVGRYDKDGKKVEAFGAFDGDFGTITVAGFGSLYMKVLKEACEDDECYCYVKNISGNAAGFLVRPEVDCEETEYGCCDTQIADNTAASGTWKISYNSSVAKKLAKQGDDADITKAYKVPSYVDSDDAGSVIIEE